MGTDLLKQEVINCVNPQGKLNKQKHFLLEHKHKLKLCVYLQTQTLPVWTKSLLERRPFNVPLNAPLTAFYKIKDRNSYFETSTLKDCIYLFHFKQL